MNHLVAIVGPTAVGKSQLAIRLAQEFNGEIVSADSRQVYRHMDIGTAKTSREELALVHHHLIGIINPDEDFSLAQYQKLAYESINDIQQRNKVPLLVGGTGQYVWATLEGWQVPSVMPDLEFRESLEQKATEGRAEELYQELLKVDPEAAKKIDQRNVRRVIRALEVGSHSGESFSQLQQKKAPPYKILMIGLTADRAELYRRIDTRVDRMIEQGLVDEVKKLLAMGYDFKLPAMSSVGYKQIGQYLEDELTLEGAVQQIKFETHRIARHQYGWFRLKDERIKWFDVMDKEGEAKVKELVGGFMSERKSGL